MSAQEQNNGNNSCDMVGLLGILIQVGLGLLSFSVLFVKRFGQNPRRPWKIWIFDTSKQGVSQMIAHFINLTISIALRYEDSSSDECLWYFITNILDNTLGVLICVLALKGIHHSLRVRGKLEYISGNYYKRISRKTNYEINENTDVKADGESGQIELIHKGSNSSRNDDNNKQVELVEQKQQQEPSQKEQKESVGENVAEIKITPEESHHCPIILKENIHYTINYKAWLVQLLIWLGIVVVSKSIFFGIEFSCENFLKVLSFQLMGWIEDYPVLELVLVIVIVPVIMNGLAFWVQDNFLKKDQSHSVQPKHSQPRDANHNNNT